MTRKYLSADERRQQALTLLRDGISISELRDAMGYASNENATRVMDSLAYAGQAHSARAKVAPDSAGRAWTTLYFLTAEARDAYVQAKDTAIQARKKERKKATRKTAPSYIKRNEQRKAARAAKASAAGAQAKELKRAQATAMRAAEAEQRKLRARLDREAKAAEKQRAKVEARTQQQRLKAETKAAGQLGKQKGTASPAPVKPRGPAHLAGELDLSRARITIAPPMPDRWAATAAPAVVSSRESRRWTEAVAA